MTQNTTTSNILQYLINNSGNTPMDNLVNDPMAYFRSKMSQVYGEQQSVPNMSEGYIPFGPGMPANLYRMLPPDAYAGGNIMSNLISKAAHDDAGELGQILAKGRDWSGRSNLADPRDYMVLGKYFDRSYRS